MTTHLSKSHAGSLGAALALTGLVALAGCSRGGSETASAATTPTTVTVGAENVAVAQLDTIQSGPAISGSLEPEREARLRAELPGNVVQTYAEQGQRVGAGAVLARIEASAIQSSVLSARSGVTSAQLAYENARRNYERSERLTQAGAVAERDLEGARSAMLAAQAQLTNARAGLAAAQRQLSSATVHAPFAGIVSQRSVSAGDVVAPGTALYTVVDPSSIKLEASVPAEQLSAVRVGAPVRFTVNGYPGRTFEGKISRVSPVADPTTRQVRITVSIPNSGNRLVGGLFAEGRVAAESRSALVVPSAAVDQRGVAPLVYRVKGGKVDRVTVQLGLRDQARESVEVVQGLAAGDTVLLGAAQGITPGTPVKVAGVNDRASR